MLGLPGDGNHTWEVGRPIFSALTEEALITSFGTDNACSVWWISQRVFPLIVKSEKTDNGSVFALIRKLFVAFDFGEPGPNASDESFDHFAVALAHFRNWGR